MTLLHHLQGRTRQGLAFWLSGWAILLVVLLSAAPTGSQLRTRLVGSAFDPATVSVVVNPKQPRLRTTAAKPNKANPPDVVHDSLAPVGIIQAGSESERWLSAAPRFTVQLASISDPRSLTRAHGARAPPAA